MNKTSDHSTTDNRTKQVVMCSMKGCTYGYCSDKCRVYDNTNNGHWLICTGGDRDSTNLTREFLTHAMKTNDLFTAGLAVVARLISIALCRVGEGSTASNESMNAQQHSQHSVTYPSRTESGVSNILDEANVTKLLNDYTQLQGWSVDCRSYGQ